jgi:hypothetical protein
MELWRERSILRTRAIHHGWFASLSGGVTLNSSRAFQIDGLSMGVQSASNTCGESHDKKGLAMLWRALKDYLLNDANHKIAPIETIGPLPVPISALRQRPGAPRFRARCSGRRRAGAYTRTHRSPDHSRRARTLIWCHRISSGMKNDSRCTFPTFGEAVVRG